MLTWTDCLFLNLTITAAHAKWPCSALPNWACAMMRELSQSEVCDWTAASSNHETLSNKNGQETFRICRLDASEQYI